MTDTKSIIQINIASLEHIDPGIALEYVLKSSSDSNGIKTAVERIIHPVEMDSPVDILIAQPITDIGIQAQVFSGRIAFIIKERKVYTASAQLKWLVQRRQRRYVPCPFFFMVIEILSGKHCLLQGDPVDLFVHRVQVNFCMHYAVHTVPELYKTHFFFRQRFGAVLLPENTVLFVCFLCSGTYFRTALFFIEG